MHISGSHVNNFNLNRINHLEMRFREKSGITAHAISQISRSCMISCIHSHSRMFMSVYPIHLLSLFQIRNNRNSKGVFHSFTLAIASRSMGKVKNKNLQSCLIYGSRPIGWPKRVEVQALSTVIVYSVIISVMTISQKKNFIISKTLFQVLRNTIGIAFSTK